MSEQAAAILGCAGPRLRADERRFFAEAQPWGFILFARNAQTPAQVKRLTDALRDAVGRDAPVLIDQEGGRVQRLGPPHWRQWLPPLDQMAQAGPEAMRLRFRLIAQELRAVGIDVNCAPCCDIAHLDTHGFIRNRCYGTKPEAVAAAAAAVADGLTEGGVLPVMKHMPGHGRARIDSHFDLPIVTEDRNTLQKTDFAPFLQMAHLPMGMTGHVVYSDIDPENPATTSSVVLEMLRNDLKFQGLLMTDDISMEALSGNLTERVTGAIGAGCDLALHCNGVLSEMQDVVAAAGPLTGQALERADAALAARTEPKPIDIAATEAQLAALLNGETDVRQPID